MTSHTLSGVSVYREITQDFSVDRIQLTAPNKQQGITNRELGTIEQLSKKQMRVRLGSAKSIGFSPDSIQTTPQLSARS
jgi:S-ribosylhomocysteine lyase LuxS involved in autoinducer biosynthesis